MSDDTTKQQDQNNLGSVLPQDNTQPEQKTTSDLPPVVVMEDVKPPMPEEQNNPQDIVNTSPADSNSGTSSPTDDIAQAAVVSQVKPPQKKFAGGRVIATILGLFLLVGGTAAGLFLVQRNQNPEEKAAGECGCTIGTTQSCTINGKAGTMKCEKNLTLCGPGTNYGYGTWGNCTASDGSGDTGPFTCPAPYSVCGGTCKNLNNDNNNCGICGFVCESSRTCTSGLCVDPNVECYQDINCANGYLCKSNKCVPNNEPVENGAPVKCTTTCPDANKVQEPGLVNCDDGSKCTGTRYECKTSSNGNDKWCTIGYGKDCCTKPTNPPSTPKPTVTPTATPISAQCQNVKAYSETWSLLSSTQLSALKSGNKAYFCVTGVATGGSFDRAKFTINNATQAETTIKRPGSDDFCQLYTIPTGVYSFNVTAQIHHVTLGWK